MAISVEHIHQRSFIQWARVQSVSNFRGAFGLPYAQPGETLFDYIHATPNGGKRDQKTKIVNGRKITYSPEGVRLKSEGVKAGVHDLQLTAPLNGYCGLWIELKAPPAATEKPGTVSKEQKEFGYRMLRAGYAVAYCWGCNEIEDAIKAYFKDDEKSLKRFAIPKYKR